MLREREEWKRERGARKAKETEEVDIAIGEMKEKRGRKEKEQ